jgi:deazaflavin-dependent oxidoreductase (nitroreductase family)
MRARENEMTDWDPEAFTKALIADLREHAGQVTSGPMAGQTLLILTTTGTKTGQPRVAVVTATRDGDAYVVAGSKGGAPTDPSWFSNLRVNPIVTIEVGGQTLQARATLAEGADRDRLWARHVAAYPAFGEYPAKTDRVIPMARLTPVG